MSIQSISVFCGSSPGTDPLYGEMAAALGTHLGEQDIQLVFGGSDAGLMGIVADAHLAADRLRDRSLRAQSQSLLVDQTFLHARCVARSMARV